MVRAFVFDWMPVRLRSVTYGPIEIGNNLILGLGLMIVFIVE
jgi:hypothetical protein